MIVNLGGNDFSTPVQPHEPWKDAESSYQSWLSDYEELVSNIRTRYGDVPVMLMAKKKYEDKISDVELLLNSAGVGQI